MDHIRSYRLLRLSTRDFATPPMSVAITSFIHAQLYNPASIPEK